MSGSVDHGIVRRLLDSICVLMCVSVSVCAYVRVLSLCMGDRHANIERGGEGGRVLI